LAHVFVRVRQEPQVHTPDRSLLAEEMSALIERRIIGLGK